ncbi:hypothetical protein PAXINDRAFT_158785 [Paxillus involutus ATCC 200175]|uniref:Uncharacterized protein n=1 Tax=Paxillus involutus ATCC 200175 TaxID=664439 RepID=A0A0C9TDI1_PAXIN|nr:hypothetical protein PAXINDRAFT_158785 [Paxillus involutus ATCC 200175]
MDTPNWIFPENNTYDDVPEGLEQSAQWLPPSPPVYERNNPSFGTNDQLPHINNNTYHRLRSTTPPCHEITRHYHTDPHSGLRRSPRKSMPTWQDHHHSNWHDGTTNPSPMVPSMNPYPVSTLQHDPQPCNGSRMPNLPPMTPTPTQQAVSSLNVTTPTPAQVSAPRCTPAGVVEKIPASVGKGKDFAAAETKKRGRKGSKSGDGRRRASRTSDDEISKLSVKQLADADLKLIKNDGLGDMPVKPESAAKRGLTEDEKFTVVQYITSPEVNKEFHLCQGSIFTKVYVIIARDSSSLTPCTQLAYIIIKNGIQPTQIRNYWWGQAWEKYKQVRELEKHMGGGDGDEDKDEEKNDDDDDNENEDSVALDGTKRKRTAKKPKFSRRVLEAFKESYDDETISHTHDVNSHDSISDNEGNQKKKPRKSSSTESDNLGETASLLHDVMGTISKCHERQERLDEVKLDLACKREQ